MAERQMGTRAGPERESGAARRLITPFAVMIVLVVLVLAIVMAVIRPWEDSDTGQRSEPPPAPTVTR